MENKSLSRHHVLLVVFSLLLLGMQELSAQPLVDVPVEHHHFIENNATNAFYTKKVEDEKSFQQRCSQIRSSEYLGEFEKQMGVERRTPWDNSNFYIPEKVVACSYNLFEAYGFKTRVRISKELNVLVVDLVGADGKVSPDLIYKPVYDTIPLLGVDQVLVAQNHSSKFPNLKDQFSIPRYIEVKSDFNPGHTRLLVYDAGHQLIGHSPIPTGITSKSPKAFTSRVNAIHLGTITLNRAPDDNNNVMKLSEDCQYLNSQWKRYISELGIDFLDGNTFACDGSDRRYLMANIARFYELADELGGLGPLAPGGQGFYQYLNNKNKKIKNKSVTSDECKRGNIAFSYYGSKEFVLCDSGFFKYVSGHWASDSWEIGTWVHELAHGVYKIAHTECRDKTSCDENFNPVIFSKNGGYAAAMMYWAYVLRYVNLHPSFRSGAEATVRSLFYRIKNPTASYPETNYTGGKYRP